MNDKTAYERFSERYGEGAVPWDETEPPPEVIAEAAALQPGRALDLGCGYGRSAIYLAGLGWQVDAIDFVDVAVTEARKRARAAGVAERARFHAGTVTNLDYLMPAYDLALDVGCLHSLAAEERQQYRQELLRLLQPGGRYLLYAPLREEGETREEGPRGILEPVLLSLFAQGFVLDRKENGLTEVDDRPPFQSAWYWYQRI